ncbi:MAG: 3-hydroxyacyl-CoA dehydrogenase [Candidatus Protistobacter heckmanni]|nr:3-hydroxyacyl-CoA dehydrogenase [Candidatus Protistobacter heckmanni]
MLTVGIVGTGAMGRGIAQIAALGGLSVRLYDTRAEAIAAALADLKNTLGKLVEKGRLGAAEADKALAALQPADSLQAMAGCDLVVEAIVEKLEAKRELFKALEPIVGPDCILATNTSSLSVTAIAAACEHPGRVAGFHFFNPVPLMKVVEVIDGVRTEPAAADALISLSRKMGHTPVRCLDMPGFVVNHAGRGLGTEGLRIVQEGIADFATVDAVMREQAGFKMDPFELMDLTALDVSHPVMESIYGQFYQEPRFRPSPITALRLAGGLLGRKTGAGFYRYENGAKQVPAEAPASAARPASVWISRKSLEGYAAASALLEKLGAKLEDGETPSADALIIVTPFGGDTTSCVSSQGLDAKRTLALDCLIPFEIAKRRVLMTNPLTSPEAREAARGLLAADGVPVSVIRDSTGFVAQRILATIVNIACDIAQQRIATPGDIDLAVTLGLGYPTGPLALGDRLGTARLLRILNVIQTQTGDPRYRASHWLARRAALGASLLQEES